jgi:iron complex outermembrane receptor protein
MNCKTNKLRDAVVYALVLSTAGTGAAFAQDSGSSNPTNLDRIEVTGSRIRQASIETAQPVITISREAIQQQGKISVADILQNLTSAGSPAISRGQVLASGENVGGYYLDLRQLGASRTLILVNGKRLGANTTGLQDLSQIPASAIERIDILKDGASSIYGSDAIAGVVNVITRRNFEGAEANAYIGQYGEGDGQRSSFDFTIGSVGERGSVTLSASYEKEDPVWAKDRWYSKDGSAGPDYPGAGWSPVSQHGSFCQPCSPASAARWYTLIPGTDPSDRANYQLHTADFNANSNEQMMAQTGVERRSIYVAADYSLADNLKFVSDFLYNHRSTDQQVAGYPFQGTLSANSVFNPLTGNASFRRRLWEVPRTTESELKTYRVTLGLEGYFEIGSKSWNWDVSALFNRNDMLKNGHGDASYLATSQALGPSFINANGVAQCGTPSNPIPLGSNLGSGQCIPWNPLLPYGQAGQGSLSNPELQTYLFPEYHDTGLTQQKVFSANLSGSIVELPAGELGLAVGFEHRKEEGRFVPDAFNQSGNSTGLPATTTEGSYSLNEVYLELNVPLLKDIPFAKELSVNLASRYSDYDTFGSTTNNKFGLVWRPTDDLLVRGTYAEGFRAPSISNLYGGSSGSFVSYSDPCRIGGPAAGGPACTAAGVPANFNQLGQGLVPCTSFPCQTPYQFLSVSNPNLTPEKSKTITAGLVYSPRFVEGLDFTLDWYKVEIDNVIATDSTADILKDCYERNVASRCAGIVRDADHVITNLTYGVTNKGKMRTEGYDFGARYRLPELAIGKFTIDWQTSYVSYLDLKPDNAEDTVYVPYTSFAGYFRTRSNLSLGWELGDFGASWTSRYYSDMKEDCIRSGGVFIRPCNNPDYIAPDVPTGSPQRIVGSNTFHDVQVRWKAPWNATVSIGADNVFNHRGPIMFSSPNNQFAYYGGFDIGRFIYMKYQQRF